MIDQPAVERERPPLSSLAQGLREAQRHFDAREDASTELIAHGILQAHGLHPGALNLLAGVALRAGRTEEAARWLEQALSVAPQPGLHYNYGNVLCAAGRPQQALHAYQRAMTLEPRFIDAHLKCALTLMSLDRAEESLRYFEQAMALQPASADAHSGRGCALLQLQRPEEALQCFEQGLRHQPRSAPLWNNCGNALRSLRRFAQALEAFERALTLEPQRAEIHNNRAIVLRALARHEEALVSYAQALRLNPSYAEAYNNRGLVLTDLLRFDEARAEFEHALALKPSYADAHNNLGVMWYQCGELQAALDCYEQALRLEPDFDEAVLNRAHAALATGDFKRGWQDYERRWRCYAPRRFAAPLWLGQEPIAGRRILLHAEQGFGDALQFCRYAALLSERGAQVLLEVPQPLVALLRTVAGVEQVMATGQSLPAFDFHCPLMSLPLALGTTLESIPATVPYLTADAAKVDFWRGRLAGDRRLKVGVAWSGGFRPGQPELWPVNQRRNMPLRTLAPLGRADARFYSLQKGQGPEAELAELARGDWDGPQLTSFVGEWADFSDSAAFVQNLDLVISVDTAVVHLAGALGKSTWMLDRFDSCWRWLRHRADSPWYPSLRLYRQTRPGSWMEPISDVVRDLETVARHAD